MLSDIVLTGQLVRLEPVQDTHAHELLRSITNEEVWAHKPVTRPLTITDMRAVITNHLFGPHRYPHVIIRRLDNRIIGSTTVHHLDMVEKRAEIGWTWLDRSCWGQGYNEDAKLQILQHSFEVLGLHRIQCTVDAANQRSQQALRRLGFVYEGTLRNYSFRLDGTRRDIMYYSILKDEWPSAKTRLQHLIAARRPSFSQ